MRKKTIFFTICLLLFASKSLLAKAGSPNSKIKSATISFQMQGPFRYDSIGVTFWQDYFFGSLFFPKNTSLGWNSKSTEGIHRLDLANLEKPGYFRIKIFGHHQNQYTFLIEPGDNLIITFEGDSLSFSGNGFAKLKCAYEIERLRRDLSIESDKKRVVLNKNRVGNSTFWGDLQEYLEEPLDSVLQIKLACLETFKSHISPIAYTVTKANVIGEDYFRRYYKFSGDYSFGLETDPTKKEIFEKLYKKLVAGLSDIEFSDEIKILSNWYIMFLRDKDKLEMKLKYGNFHARQDKMLPYIHSNFKGELRDKYLTDLLLVDYSPGESYDSLFKESLSIVKTPYCLEILDRLKTNLALSVEAFPFELKDPSGRVVKLSDFKGRTIFLDFWYTGCGWCVKYYANTLHEVEKHFENNNDIVFISVCIDVSKSQWLKSIEGGKYTGKDVVNLYTGGLGSNFPLIRHYNIIGYPHQIIIDKFGKNNRLGGIQNLRPDQLISLLNEVSAQH